jgi:tetratricopeptide (TPR) repeat protein
MKIKESYGVEIYPFSSLAIRGGIACDTWHSGFGIISRDMDIDYAYVDRKEGFKHYIQYTRKFASPTTVREKELAAKEKILKKEQLYVRAQAEYNKEKIALANQLVQKYMEEYGKDKRILEIRDDIREWINKKREKNMGRVGELKNEILKDYYQGQIKEARRKLLEEGKYQQSEDELVEALKINPDSVEVIDLHKRLQEVLKLNEEE